MVDKVRSKGSGFVEYLWKKPATGKPTKKISYVKGFEPWGWVIGTGIYIDDVDRIFWNKAVKLAFLMVILTFIVIVVSWVIARSITGPLSIIGDHLHLFASGDLRINDNRESHFIQRTDEVGQLMKTLNTIS